MNDVPPLSKSRFLAGRQCVKRLWLACRAPALGAPPGAAQQAIFEQGGEVGRRAHALFPGGVLVAEAPWLFAQAVARTRALLADASVPAIFEGAFEHAGARIRVDALERLPGGRWGLREVKSAVSLQEHHLADCALQQFVLEGCGLRIGSVELLHVDRDYLRGEGPIDWRRFFVRREIGELVRPVLREVPDELVRMQRVVAHDAVPAVEPGRHCHAPHACEFWEHCTSGKPADWIHHLPRLRAARLEELRALGVERIAAIPDDFELSRQQRRIREVLRSGRPFVSEELVRELGPAEEEACYLDFETTSPAIPQYPGTRPYQQIPFQWSLHRLDASGALAHAEFLADGAEDPRRPFAQSLLGALAQAPEARIHVYSSFERSVLNGLALHLPDLAAPLGRLAGRLVDLHAVVQEHVYLPGFDFSYSIKRVAPALVPGFGWDDLDEISDGAAASMCFAELASGRLPPGEAARLRSALLAYCSRDSLALVRVHRALRRLARTG
jgi:hypothetical protein